MKKRLLTLIFSILFAGLLQISLQANTISLMEIKIQESEKKVDTVEIKTSAVCEMCKERLEHDMAFEKGVKSVDLNSESKVLTIIFKPNKTNKEELKIAVTKIGYDADELTADQKAHDRLPACCQKGADPH